MLARSRMFAVEVPRCKSLSAVCGPSSPLATFRVSVPTGVVAAVRRKRSTRMVVPPGLLWLDMSGMQRYVFR